MRRQASTLLVSSLLVLVMFVVATRLPAPYVRLLPGPVSDTLGTADGKPLITIAHPTAASDGRIYVLTVFERGGPRQNISSFQILEGWWNKSDAIIPRRFLFSDKDTSERVNKQDTDDMVISQEDAKVAALRYLGYPLKPGVDIATVNRDALKGSLKVDDIIVGVDATAVPNRDVLLAVTTAHKPGDQVTLHVVRGTQT